MVNPTVVLRLGLGRGFDNYTLHTIVLYIYHTPWYQASPLYHILQGGTTQNPMMRFLGYPVATSMSPKIARSKSDLDDVKSKAGLFGEYNLTNTS